MPEAKVIRFLLAGAFNTAFGLVAYAFFVWLGTPLWLALVCAMLAGIACNFLTLGGYAFRDLSLAHLPRFIASYAVCYLVNLAALHLLEPLVAGAIVRQMLLTPPMAVFSYVCLSRLVFRVARDH
jgi:putative flippase GtrA